MSEIVMRKTFSQSYIDSLFVLWYSLGKPTISRFMPKVYPDESSGNAVPKDETVSKWISHEWRDKAAILDAQVMDQINAKMVAEKIEMLNRHAEIGVAMQNMALEYLSTHKDELGSNTSVRLLVAGYEIERQSRGIATTVEKITNMSDSDLEKEIQKLIERSSVEFQPLDGDIIDISDADNNSE